MSDATTNPGSGESSYDLNAAATAITNLLNPKKSPPVDQSEGGGDEKVVSEVETPEAHEEPVEESVQDQPEDGATSDAEVEDEFLFGEEKVTASKLKEWRDSGLRMDDYTRKTQELAQEKRAWEEQRQKEEAQFRQQWQDRLTKFADVVIDELKPFENVDWDKLRVEDPYEYQLKFTDFQRARERAGMAQNAIQEKLREEQARQEAARSKNLEVQAVEAKKLIPELADPVKAEALVGEMSSYLKNVGFTPEEMATITGARDLKVIYDAMRYAKLTSGSKDAAKKKVVAVSKVVKPGAPQSNREVRSERSAKQEQQLMGKLRKSGSLADAAALITRRQR